MPPEWVERHARGARTDSRTLPPAAFPSLLGQQPRAAPTPPSREDSGVDLTESDKEGDPPISTDSNEANVVNGVSWEATKYHFGQYTQLKNRVKESILAERQRLINSGVLPRLKNLSSNTRPRSVNYENLQAKHAELTNKRKALEIKLRLLGYNDRRLEASIRGLTARNQPQRPASIDSLWRTVQDLKWLIHKLELIESHAHCTAKAKKKFFSRLLNFKEKPDISFAARLGAQDIHLRPIGWHNDCDWHTMHATARKLLIGDEELQTQPHSMASWPRPYYMPSTDSPAKTLEPSFVDHRSRPHGQAIGGTRAAPILIGAVAEEKDHNAPIDADNL